MKRRFLTALFLLPFLLAVAALLACNLHRLLSGSTGFVYQPMTILELLMQERKVQLFFLAFAACSLLLLIACLVTGPGVQYKNSTVRVAPGIYIPVSAGNGEYGTARFSSQKAMRKIFARSKLKGIKKLKKEMKSYETDAAGWDTGRMG